MAEIKTSYTKTELITELEGNRDIIIDPDLYSWQELAERVRYIRCANCIAYEDHKGCKSCIKEILYEYDDFYES